MAKTLRKPLPEDVEFMHASRDEMQSLKKALQPLTRKLAARFRYSQSFMQDDPWAKRAAGEDAELHQHLAEVRPLEYAL